MMSPGLTAVRSLALQTEILGAEPAEKVVRWVQAQYVTLVGAQPPPKKDCEGGRGAKVGRVSFHAGVFKVTPLLRGPAEATCAVAHLCGGVPEAVHRVVRLEECAGAPGVDAQRAVGRGPAAADAREQKRPGRVREDRAVGLGRVAAVDEHLRRRKQPVSGVSKMECIK